MHAKLVQGVEEDDQIVAFIRVRKDDMFRRIHGLTVRLRLVLQMNELLQLP